MSSAHAALLSISILLTSRTRSDVVCNVIERFDHFRPHNHFPAQSLHFRFGSVAPCPTLKPNVTASTPRTRYRRLVRPYLIGFSYCIIISLPKLAELLPLARGNQLCWFLSSHLISYYTAIPSIVNYKTTYLICKLSNILFSYKLQKSCHVFTWQL